LLKRELPLFYSGEKLFAALGRSMMFKTSFSASELFLLSSSSTRSSILSSIAGIAFVGLAVVVLNFLALLFCHSLSSNTSCLAVLSSISYLNSSLL